MRTLLGLLAAAGLMGAADPMVSRGELERMASVAKTPKEHVAVAKQFRLQAEDFEKKAARHEAEARKVEGAPRPAMVHKWPAMGSNQPWVKERALAMEARRAARECLEAAERHMRLSVEKLADAEDRRSSQRRGSVAEGGAQ